MKAPVVIAPAVPVVPPAGSAAASSAASAASSSKWGWLKSLSPARLKVLPLGILGAIVIVAGLVLAGVMMTKDLSGGGKSASGWGEKKVVTPHSIPDRLTVPEVKAAWKPIEIGPKPFRFNKDGIHPWDMDIPLGCIKVRLAKWAGGTEHGPYCGKGPKAKTPRGAEWVWSANGESFPAMYILYPN